MDFGVIEAIHEGGIVDVHELIMSFTASNTDFIVLLNKAINRPNLYLFSELFKYLALVVIGIALKYLIY